MTRVRILVGIATAVVVAAGAAVAIAVNSASGVTGRPSSAKPNIVFVLTDDLSLNLISHMPHVQAMQKSGTTMSNYYVVDSLCCPSRSAIFTGEYPHDDGVFTNTGDDGGYNAYNKNGNEKNAFAVSLKGAGYRTGFMGKYLNDYLPNNPVPPGWDEWDVTGKGYKEFDYSLNENGTQHTYGHDPKDYLTDVISKKGGEFIDSAASAGKPFMLEMASFAPHGPYTPAPRDADSFPNVTYPRTPAYDTAPTNAPSWLKGRPPLTPKQQSKLAASYRKRVQAVQSVDDMIAHLQSELKAKGVDRNTYFVFSSDNGYHMGENRLLAGKQTAFDTDIHVPLVVTGPSVPAGHTESRLTSNVDLAPTFEKLGDAKIHSSTDGVSLDALWHCKPPKTWQQAVLIEHHGPDQAASDPDKQNKKKGNPPSYEAVRTSTGVYVHYTSSGEKEYYDTAHDRYERNNIAAKGVPSSMTKSLAALQSCHGAKQCQAAAQLH